MHLLTIGSKGRLGKTLLKIFPDSSGIDIDNSENLKLELEKADFTFLAVPLEATLNIIKSFPEYNGFIDLTSVKSKVIEFSEHIISIHPLFGPESYGKNKTIIFIDDISGKNSLSVIKELFYGYNIISMGALEHDRLIAELLVKPYIFSYISDASNPGIEAGSYTKFLEVEKIKDNESSGVLLDTIKYNVMSAEIIVEIENKLNELKKLIGNR